jgi:outer membrane protein assembly factor BamB
MLEHRLLLATNITQYHVDSQSTGANLTETQLTPSNVNGADFGQLYNTPLDGEVYAEPLVLTNVTITAGPNTIGTPGTYTSVVFVATQHDSLYAIDAANGAILWQRTFLDTTNSNDHLPGATSVSTVPSEDTNSTDISPEIGITSTPVIDPSTNIIYVLPKTKEMVGGNAYYVQRLHAINVSNGTDAAPAFVIGSTKNG